MANDQDVQGMMDRIRHWAISISTHYKLRQMTIAKGVIVDDDKAIGDYEYVLDKEKEHVVINVTLDAEINQIEINGEISV